MKSPICATGRNGKIFQISIDKEEKLNNNVITLTKCLIKDNKKEKYHIKHKTK
jgi:hypothetical protein